MNRPNPAQDARNASGTPHTMPDSVPPARNPSQAVPAASRADDTSTLDALAVALAALVALGMIGRGDAGLAVLWVLLAGAACLVLAAGWEPGCDPDLEGDE